MEAAKEDDNLLTIIRPPRFEDAGLEDCALSHESIKEAFFKAANSLRSWSGTDADSDSDDHCIEGKSFLPPNDGGLSDTLIGISPISDPPGSCSNEKGGVLPEVLGDEVIVGGGKDRKCEDGSDKVVDSDVHEGFSDGDERSCVDGLQGLKIHGNEADDDDEEDRESDNPILVEALI